MEFPSIYYHTIIDISIPWYNSFRPQSQYYPAQVPASHAHTPPPVPLSRSGHCRRQSADARNHVRRLYGSCIELWRMWEGRRSLAPVRGGWRAGLRDVWDRNMGSPWAVLAARRRMRLDLGLRYRGFRGWLTGIFVVWMFYQELLMFLDAKICELFRDIILNPTNLFIYGCYEIEWVEYPYSSTYYFINFPL